MRPDEQRNQRKATIVEDPPLVRALLGDVRWSWIWLVVRVYAGWQWLGAGWAKLQSPDWMQQGAALRSLWTRALDPIAGVSPGWFAELLRWLLDSGSYVWVARAVAMAETLVGIALILGLVTGVAAFVGSLVSLSLVLAGAGLMNPVLLGLAVALMLAWKTAGWIGLDRWLLPVLGTSWRGRTPLEPRGAERRSRSSMVEAPR